MLHFFWPTYSWRHVCEETFGKSNIIGCSWWWELFTTSYAYQSFLHQEKDELHEVSPVFLEYDASSSTERDVSSVLQITYFSCSLSWETRRISNFVIFILENIWDPYISSHPRTVAMECYYCQSLKFQNRSHWHIFSWLWVQWHHVVEWNQL